MEIILIYSRRGEGIMKKIVSIILALIVSITLSGCFYKVDLESKKDSKSIIISVERLPYTLADPMLFTIREKELYYAIFEGLVEKDSQGNISPVLAESYSVSEDGLEYTFKLKNNIYWSSGKKITADDFIKFFKEILSPSNKEEYIKDLYTIYGVEDYHLNRVDFQNHVAISKVNSNTFKIRMNKKDNELLSKLCEPQYRLRDMNEELDNYKKSYKNITCSGAYFIENIEEDKQIILKLNDKYWNKKNETPEKIILKIYPGAELALADYRTNGDIDIITGISYTELEKKQKSNYEIFPVPSTTFIEFNLSDNSYTKNLTLRKVIETSINQSLVAYTPILNDGMQLANYCFDRREIKDDTIATNGTESFPYSEISKEDIEKKLEDARYDGETLQVIGEKTTENDKLLTYLAKDLQDKFGIKLKCKLYDKDELEDRIKRGFFDLLIREVEKSSDIEKQWEADIMKVNVGASISKEINKFDSTKYKSKEEYIANIIENQRYAIPVYFKNIVCLKSDKIKELIFDKEGVLLINELEYN